MPQLVSWHCCPEPHRPRQLLVKKHPFREATGGGGEGRGGGGGRGEGGRGEGGRGEGRGGGERVKGRSAHSPPGLPAGAGPIWVPRE